MRIKYSPDADVLMIRLRDGKHNGSSDPCEGVTVHFDEIGAPLEIEILDASKVIDMGAVDVSLSVRPKITFRFCRAIALPLDTAFGLLGDTVYRLPHS